MRSENQDRLLVVNLSDAERRAHPRDLTNDASVGPVRFEIGAEGAILLVADGMGGRAGGAHASGLAVTAIHEVMVDGGSATALATTSEFVDRLRHALNEANRTIYEEAVRDDHYRGMGTTATLAGIFGGVAYLAQVGDSRAYLVRGGQAIRLTRDQSLVQDMIDSGVLSEDDARNVKNGMILQALGTAATVRPELTFHELRRDDVLLLCSDGLSQVVRDEEIAALVSKTTLCAELCDALISMANERGGPDNVTVLVARMRGDGLEPALVTDALGRQMYDRSRG